MSSGIHRNETTSSCVLTKISSILKHVLPISFGLTFSDVLLIPQYSDISSRSEVSLKTQLTPKVSLNFPVTAANMDTIVGVDMAIALSKLGSVAFYPRFASPEVQAGEIKQILDAGCFTIPSVGIKKDEQKRVELLVNLGLKVLLVDVAHGHQQTCLDYIKFLKSKYPDVELVAGNVATYEATKALYEAGASCVKVGVGPGSTCTTRIVTGSGMPQITAIMNCARASSEFSLPLIADGGMKNSGDIVKALAAGANIVMSGNMFAGTNETPGEIISKDGKQFKSFNGSTSATEKKVQYQKYLDDKSPDYVKHVEGLERLVPIRGPVSEIIDQLSAGIRSGLSYSGARNISELHQKAQFVQVTSSVINENQNREITRL